MNQGAEGWGQESEVGSWLCGVSLGMSGAGRKRVVEGRAWEPGAGSQP